MNGLMDIMETKEKLWQSVNFGFHQYYTFNLFVTTGVDSSCSVQFVTAVALLHLCIIFACREEHQGIHGNNTGMFLPLLTGC
jgi:hypothetical protein